MYDWANSAFATVVLSAVLPVYFVALVPEKGALISFLGFSRTIQATALWGYAVSLSMLIVAITSPYLGSMADRSGMHRRFLFAYCFITVLGRINIAVAAGKVAGGENMEKYIAFMGLKIKRFGDRDGHENIILCHYWFKVYWASRLSCQ